MVMPLNRLDPYRPGIKNKYQLTAATMTRDLSLLPNTAIRIQDIEKELDGCAAGCPHPAL